MKCTYYRRADGSVIAVWTSDGKPIGATSALDENAQKRLPHEHEFTASAAKGLKLEELKSFGLELHSVNQPTIKGGIEPKTEVK